MKRSRTRAATVAVLLSLMFLGAVGALAGEKLPYQGYLEFETLSTWRFLSPEIASAEVCDLTPAGHVLWEEGQLRLPDPSLGGDFNVDGFDDRAIRLRIGSESPCEYVLLVTLKQQAWDLLQLQRVKSDEYAGGALLWMSPQQAIGIDSGQKERFTRSATMWSDGEHGGGSAGYVIDVKLVFHTIRWNPIFSRFEYERRDVPHKIAEEDELELLRRDGHL